MAELCMYVIANQRVGAKRRPMTGSRSNPFRRAKEEWIASSRSLSSGAHSRDPLAPRNDGLGIGCLKIEPVTIHFVQKAAPHASSLRKAGTHNHQRLLQRKPSATVPKREAAAYGSLLSRLCENVSGLFYQ